MEEQRTRTEGKEEARNYKYAVLVQWVTQSDPRLGRVLKPSDPGLRPQGGMQWVEVNRDRPVCGVEDLNQIGAKIGLDLGTKSVMIMDWKRFEDPEESSEPDANPIVVQDRQLLNGNSVSEERSASPVGS